LQESQDKNSLLVVHESNILAETFPVADTTPGVAVTPVVSGWVGSSTVLFESKAFPESITLEVCVALGCVLDNVFVSVKLDWGDLEDGLGVFHKSSAGVDTVGGESTVVTSWVSPRAHGGLSNVEVVAVLDRWVDVLAHSSEEEALVPVSLGGGRDGVVVSLCFWVSWEDSIELEDNLGGAEDGLALILLGLSWDTAVFISISEVDAGWEPLTL